VGNLHGGWGAKGNLLAISRVCEFLFNSITSVV